MVATISRTCKSHKPQKQVTVIARYTLKRNGHVIYAVRSSNGVDQYQVLVIGGVVQSCSCPAHSHCYHKRGIQIIEENRREAEMRKEQVATPATIPVVEVMQAAQAEMQKFDLDAGPNAYDVLATTKRTAAQREEEETRRSYMKMMESEY